MADPGDREPLASGYHGRMLGLLSFVSLVSIAGRLVLPALLPTIIERFAISPSGAGPVLSVMLAGITLAQYPGGRGSDQLSRKTVLAAALGLFITGFAVVAAAPSYGVLLSGAAVVGLGLAAVAAVLVLAWPTRA